MFFFIVGNELKQEFVHGQFRDPRQALVPMVAAVTGALVPAALFALITLGTGDAARAGGCVCRWPPTPRSPWPCWR